MSITLTTWKIRNIDTIEQFVSNLELVNRRLEEVGWGEDSPNYIVSSNIEGYGYDYIHNITLGNVEYKYISFRVTVERAKQKNKWYDECGNLKDRRERINTYPSDMLAYVANNEVTLIVFSAKTTAARILNHAFDNEIWKEREEINWGIDEDIFYWLLKRLRDYPAVNLHNSVNINITGLWSYLGTTGNGSNAFRGKGRRVLAVLGTLAIIFSSEELRALRPEFQHNGNTVVVELNLDNTIKIYDDYYLGNFNVYQGQEKGNVLALYIINELIPNILESYNKNKEDDLWSIQLKSDFLRTIGQEIMERVEEELDLLENDDLSEEEEENVS